VRALPGAQHGQPPFAENVKVLISWHVLLQQPEAVGVDRPTNAAPSLSSEAGPSRSSTWVLPGDVVVCRRSWPGTASVAPIAR
jgi:hypothetical protein